MADFKEFYEKQIEYYKHNVEWCTEQIAWETSMLEKYRKTDRELVEYVWSKGVVTKVEASIFHKGYQSEDTKQALKFRRKYYLWRKKSVKTLAEYEKKLKELK